jgi:hypothetical protein
MIGPFTDREPKSVRTIVGEGRRYMAAVAGLSLASALAWHAVRGGGVDFLGLRLITAAFAVCAGAVVLFGGNQGGVGLLMSPFVTSDALARLMRAEIASSDAQRFHPLHAVLGAMPVGLLGLGVMLAL